MELYKIAKIKLEKYGKEFKEEIIEFLEESNYIYRVKCSTITIYGIKAQIDKEKYPSDKEIEKMCDDYIDYLDRLKDRINNPDDDPKNEVSKEAFKELVNYIENYNSDKGNENND